MKTILETKLSEKEDRLAQQLRQACDKNGKEIDFKESGRIFHQLGRIYRQRSPDKFNLIRSAGLFNAALIRQPGNEQIQSDLDELCNHVLELSRENQYSNNSETDSEMPKRLTCISAVVAKKVMELRDETKRRLNQTHPIDDVNIEEQKELEKKKIAEIEEVQNMITLRYKEIMQSVSQECVGLIGKAPCEFALVGLGSLAKKEVTPYSDFENIILLEEFRSKNNNYWAAVEYFRWFSLLFHIILINLKETIIPCLHIPSLRDDKYEKCWFYDVETKRGISFDLMVCPLGKPPTSNNHEPFELIKTVSDMFQHLEPEFNEKKGYYLSEFLTKPCFIYGNHKIYSSYSEEVSRRIKLFVNHTAVSQQLKGDINNFDAFTKFTLALAVNKCNVKRVFYRSTTLFIYAVGQICNLEGDSCFDIVRQILAAGRIDAANAHSLMYAVAVSCEIRLKVYGSFGRAADDLENFSNEHQKHLQSLVGLNSLITCLETALALQRSIKEKVYFTPYTPKINYIYFSPFVFRCTILNSLGYNHRLFFHFSKLLFRDLKSLQFTAFVERIIGFLGVCSLYYIMLYGILNLLHSTPYSNTSSTSVPFWVNILQIVSSTGAVVLVTINARHVIETYLVKAWYSILWKAFLKCKKIHYACLGSYLLFWALTGNTILRLTFSIIFLTFFLSLWLIMIYAFYILFRNDAILCISIVCSTLFSHWLGMQTADKMPEILPYTLIASSGNSGNWAWFNIFMVLVSSATSYGQYLPEWLIPCYVIIHILGFCLLIAFYCYDTLLGVKKEPFRINWSNNPC